MSGRTDSRHTRRSKRVDGSEAVRTPRDRYLQKRFKLTERQYLRICEYQKGICPICGTSPKTRPFPVDHDHTSKKKPSRWYGRIRGAPCHRCNRFRIGVNDVESAYRVWRYLESEFNGRDL